jgi:hypothetical protein
MFLLFGLTRLDFLHIQIWEKDYGGIEIKSIYRSNQQWEF